MSDWTTSGAETSIQRMMRPVLPLKRFEVPINLQRPSVMNGDDTFWYFTIFRAHEPLEHGVIVWIHGFSSVFMGSFDSFDPTKIFGAHHETLQAAPSPTCPLRFAGLCRKPLMQCGCLNLSVSEKSVPQTPATGIRTLFVKGSCLFVLCIPKAYKSGGYRWAPHMSFSQACPRLQQICHWTSRSDCVPQKTLKSRPFFLETWQQL